MSSRGKKKTTMAKLTRETRLRERRVEKQARKEARRNAPPAEPVYPGTEPVYPGTEPLPEEAAAGSQ